MKTANDFINIAKDARITGAPYIRNQEQYEQYINGWHNILSSIKDRFIKPQIPIVITSNVTIDASLLHDHPVFIIVLSGTLTITGEADDAVMIIYGLSNDNCTTEIKITTTGTASFKIKIFDNARLTFTPYIKKSNHTAFITLMDNSEGYIEHAQEVTLYDNASAECIECKAVEARDETVLKCDLCESVAYRNDTSGEANDCPFVQCTDTSTVTVNRSCVIADGSCTIEANKCQITAASRARLTATDSTIKYHKSSYDAKRLADTTNCTFIENGKITESWFNF